MSGRDELSGVHVWLVLWKAYRALARHAHASVNSLGIGPSDFGVLEVVLHKGPTAVNAIAEKVQLSSGSATAAVDRLEARGLVERKPDATDRRARIVHLTPCGRALIEGAFENHSAKMEWAASALSDAERAELLRLLKKLGLGAQERFEAADGLDDPCPENRA